jgi:Cu2+-exporting ATPase
VTRGKGDAAFAATVVSDGHLTIRATRVGADTTAGQIVRLVESAPIGDTRMQNHAERLADRLVVPELVLATGAAVVSGDFDRFLSLVIVDYGTGIRVAAPTAVLASMTHAARTGIIIKSGRHLERLAEVDTVVFDKTGTLTHGTPAVLDVLTYQDHITPGHLLGLAAAAETKYRVGLGVEGQVNGYYLHVGNERFMRQSDICVRRTANDRCALDEQGYSCVYIAVDGAVAGMVPYSDEIRAESRSVLHRLRSMGVKNSVMLTGDNAVVARAVGRRLSLTRHFSDMLPADKADAIAELQRAGNVVAMVGDGINDSPALSYADVGIAMKHGAEVAHESAHVVLMEDSLWKLVKAVEISQGAVHLIKQNYAIVAGLNTLALALALPGGLITPTVTALISNGSAIVATLNGLRPILRYR